MNKNWMKASIALIILFLLLVLGWWKDKKIKTEESTKAQAETVPTVKLDEAVYFKVINANGEFQFEKRKKNTKGEFEDSFSYLNDEIIVLSPWILRTKMGDFISSNSMMDSLSSHFELLKSVKIISETDERASEYGLKPAKIKIQLFKTKKETPDWEMLVGDQNTAGSQVYVKVSNSPKIYLVENIFGFLEKDEKEWKEPRWMGFPNIEKVKKLKFEKDGKDVFILSKNEQNQWWLVSPKHLPSDEAAVTSILQEIETLHVKEFMAPEQVKTLGINPKTKFTVWTDESGVVKEKIVFIGNVNAKDDKMYVQRAENNQVLAVRTSFNNTLNKPYQEFITKKLFSLNIDEVKKINISLGQVPYELIKDKSEWVLKNNTTSNSAKTPYTDVYSLLGFEAERFVGMKPNQVGDIFLSIAFDAGEKSESLEIYKSQTGQYWGFSKKHDLWYALDTQKVSTLETGIKNFIEGKTQEDIKVKSEHSNPEMEHDHDDE